MGIDPHAAGVQRAAEGVASEGIAAPADPSIDRLLPADLMMLWPEDYGWREDIGAIAVLDPPVDGDLDVGRVRALVESRLHLVPRLRQVLVRPAKGLGGPYWADDQHFDVREHVGIAPLPDGAGEAELLAEVERLRRRPFDPARPRWEMWLLPGLPDHRTGLYLKLHHAVADGLAGIALIGAFLDLEGDAAPTDPVPWHPRPVPTESELRADARIRRAAARREAVSGARDPVRTVRRAWASAGALWRIERTRAPRTALNRPIGAARQLSLVRLDLEAARELAHRHHATINDVVLALTADGLRALARHRGEATEDLVLRAVVPVSLHDEGAGPASGNQDGSMLVPLALGSCSPAARIEAVADASKRAKRSVFVPPSGVLARTELAQRATWRHFDRQRWANTYVANLPGPPIPLHLAGARLHEVFPVVPLTGNITVGVGAMSYAGVLALAFVADVDTCNDLHVFEEAVAASLDALGLRSVADG